MKIKTIDNRREKTTKKLWCVTSASDDGWDDYDVLVSCCIVDGIPGSPVIRFFCACKKEGGIKNEEF